MKIVKYHGVYKVYYKKHQDQRGFFHEVVKNNYLNINGNKIFFRQDNISHSKKNVFRGFHFQKNPYQQGKLIHVIKGSITDLFFKLTNRKKSTVHSIFLSDKDNFMIYIPDNFAHGFYTHSSRNIVMYKCTKLYMPKSESGYFYGSKDLIYKDFNFSSIKPITSSRDLSW